MKMYNKSDKFYKHFSGACSCAGAMYKEPHCPCEMFEKGLPMSVEHVKTVKEVEKRMEEVLRETNPRRHQLLLSWELDTCDKRLTFLKSNITD